MDGGIKAVESPYDLEKYVSTCNFPIEIEYGHKKEEMKILISLL